MMLIEWVILSVFNKVLTLKLKIIIEFQQSIKDVKAVFITFKKVIKTLKLKVNFKHPEKKLYKDLRSWIKK